MSKYVPSGTLIGGRYLVKACGKEGHTAVIFKCLDRVTNKIVAVKRFIPDRIVPETEQKVFSEVKLNLRSDYLVMAENAFLDNGILHAVMPFVEGESLDHTLACCDYFCDQKATFVALCVAYACNDLHSRGIISTDIKSGNIMLPETGVCKLIDLSTWERIGEKPVISMGTAPYAPRELIKGERLHKATDLFSLGVVYYEMLVGQEVFDSKIHSWENIIQNGDKPDISIIKNSFPGATRIISKAIEPNPSNRYRRASEMYSDLYRHYQSISKKTQYNSFSLVCPNGEKIDISKGTHAIGRRNVGLCWEYVSERHLEINFSDDSACIRDAGSSNGTRLNGTSVNGSWIDVGEGDVVSLADCNLTVNIRSK